MNTRTPALALLTFGAAVVMGSSPSPSPTPTPGTHPAPAPGPIGVGPEASQRVVLITGSTSGLGREVARALAERGDHIIVHGRSVERGREVVDEIHAETAGSARFYPADFASLDEVRTLAAHILRDYDRLDVLVNNAGIYPVTDPQRRLSEDGHELTFQVNYLAAWLLTEELVPLLRASAPSRIVNVSSIASSPIDFDNVMLEEGYSGGRAYGQSKLAQVMHTVDLAAAHAGSGVSVIALHPATMMNTRMIEGQGLQARSSVQEGRDHLLELLDGDEGAVSSGEFFVNGTPDRRRHAQAYDPAARDALRRLSEKLAGRP